MFIGLGHLSLFVGFIGVFLPLLPTTPLVILAAFCYSKGSERLHQWILQQRTFGPLVREWRAHGVIRPRAKALSTALMLLTFSYPLVFGDLHWAIKLLVAAIGLSTLSFILSRPSRPPDRAAPASPMPADQPEFTAS
jgi:hypothetical protein